jgi:xylulokinase
MEIYLGIDIGTTNLKVGAFTLNGDLLSLKKEATPTQIGKDGLQYYDASEFWNIISSLIKDLCYDLKHYTIASVTTTGMAEAMVAIDKNGKCLDYVIPWFDTRSKSFSSQIKKDLGSDKIFRITGLDVNPVFSLPKLMLIKDMTPEVFRNAEVWLQMPEFILYKLCGKFYSDYSLASRTMLFDIHTNVWSDELLDYASIKKSNLPEIVDGGTKVGQVSFEASRETGLTETCAVVVGGHDHICGTIPAGAINGEHVLDSSGTAESFIYVSKANSPLPKAFSGLRVGRYLTKDKYALWGGIVSSGSSVEWGIQRLCNGKEFDGNTFDKLGYDTFFDTHLKDVPIGSNNLLFLPHLRGAGAPYWEPAMRGAFIGLSSKSTNAELMKAIFEGLAMQSRMIIEYMEEASGSDILALNTVGGGSRLTYWQSIKALVNGRTINIPSAQEATLLGAAMLGAIGVGAYKTIEEASNASYKIVKSISYNSDTLVKYDQLYEVFKKASELIKEISHDLTDFC